MLVVLEEGSVWSWGQCIWGQLGLGGKGILSAGGSTTNPTRVGGVEVFGDRIVSASCGYTHSAAVSATGSVFTWGQARHAMLGHGDEEIKMIPTRIGKQMLAGLSALQVACGRAYTVVLTVNGCVWTVGHGSMGQLGHGNRDNKSQLTRVSPEAFSGAVIVMIAAGFSHTVASDMVGGIWSWGGGQTGRLGHGDQEDQLIPTQITDSAGRGRCVLVSTGIFHTVAVMNTGELLGWGSNKDGQIGLGHAIQVVTPALTHLAARASSRRPLEVTIRLLSMIKGWCGRLDADTMDNLVSTPLTHFIPPHVFLGCTLDAIVLSPCLLVSSTLLL